MVLSCKWRRHGGLAGKCPPFLTHRFCNWYKFEEKMLQGGEILARYYYVPIDSIISKCYKSSQEIVHEGRSLALKGRGPEIFPVCLYLLLWFCDEGIFNFCWFVWFLFILVIFNKQVCEEAVIIFHIFLYLCLLSFLYRWWFLALLLLLSLDDPHSFIVLDGLWPFRLWPFRLNVASSLSNFMLFINLGFVEFYW